jgi:prophage regulatory protein
MSMYRKPEVKLEFGWRSNASVSNSVRDGLLTKPVQLGPRAVGWPDYEIKAINAARIAGKSEADIKALVTRLHAKRQELAAA